MSVPKPCFSACNATGRHQCMQSSGGLQIIKRVSAVFSVRPALIEDGQTGGRKLLCTCSDTALVTEARQESL